jgi:tRNA threonylcarbamoyladenosine biosynthesis protein TsaE
VAADDQSRVVVTHSEAETRAVARKLAAATDAGTTILLYGDLGAGKTAFVKGLAEGLGFSADDVTSPTFTLVHEYRGGRLPLVHVDLYRLDDAELEEIGLDAELAAAGVLAVEWPERLCRTPSEAVRVEINQTGNTTRRIEIAPPELLENLDPEKR